MVNVPDEALADLADRLRRARLPKEQAGPDWATGTPLSYARRLRDYWLDVFDWRAWEARINRFDQRVIDIDGYEIHVLIEPGSGTDPLPLLLTSGWPGSFLEFIDVVDGLAHPERWGGDPEDGYTIVLPSLPGYGFSPPPAAPIKPTDVAALWSRLTERLGFERYGAYGSDWGSLVTANLALHHPERLAGILITSAGLMPAVGGSDAAPPTPEEQAWMAAAEERMRLESGYQLVQGTKPQSLAYGHTDSPLALACWIAEKFHGWTTPGSLGDPVIPMDALLANVMLYWINGSLSPMWLYLFLGEFTSQPQGTRVSVPASFLLAAQDLSVPPPRSWLERTFEVARFTISPAIGHFPGYENPELLIGEIRACFRAFRGR